jgi:hypothetical protein
MPIRNIKRGGGKKVAPKKVVGKKAGGGKGSKIVKKGGSNSSASQQSSSVCSSNTLAFGDSCLSWIHILLIAGLIALSAFAIYIYLEDRKQNIMIGEMYSQNRPIDYNGSELREKVRDSNKYKHDVNINIKHEPNHNRLSYVDQLHQKNHERIINPLLPPERSYVNTYGIPINVPSRGVSAGTQQVGILYKTAISDTGETIGNNSETNILPLFGAPIYPGSRKWNYYTTSDKFHSFKMPITKDGRKCDTSYGCDEIYTNDEITLPAYNGTFKVEIYDFDKPRYIPFQF